MIKKRKLEVHYINTLLCEDSSSKEFLPIERSVLRGSINKLWTQPEPSAWTEKQWEETISKLLEKGFIVKVDISQIFESEKTK